MKKSSRLTSIITLGVIALTLFAISMGRSLAAASSPTEITANAPLQERVAPQRDALSSTRNTGHDVNSPLVGPVSVTATAGTTGPTDYATLKLAFDAINAGTHQGAITIDINGNTTETASAVLNNSGAGSASYTSVSITPSGGARTISGNIVGAIIKLNGADNVTIDGRIGGTGRNLTVSNSSTTTATGAIWLASVVAGNGASNNIIRNLEIACGVTNNNASSTFGIIMCGTTISTTANGDDNDNNQFIFNRIIRARYGIVTRGVTTNLNIAPIVTDNIIGPASFGADEIGKTGILMQADTGAIVSRNTIQFVGGDLANTTSGADRLGIALGSESWSATASTTLTSNTYTVTKNIIHDVVEQRTFSAVGIELATTGGGSPTNNLIANNFIYNIRADGTSGDQVCGIGIVGGHTDKVVFNSISLTGDMDPGASSSSSTYGNAIRIPNLNGATHANLTLADNSIYLDVNSNTAANHYYAITNNGAAYSFGTGFENYNNLYINAANAQLRTGGLGTATGNAETTEFATLANWQAAYTVNQDANSIQADPLYLSTTSDLHILGGSPNVNTGLTIAGVADDIDSQVRPNGANPDIGADEFYASPGTLQFSSASYSGNEGNMVTVTVSRGSGSSGTVGVTLTLNDGTATGGGACGAGVDFVNPGPQILSFGDSVLSQTINVQLCSDAVFDPVETFTATLSSPTGGATLGSPTTATVTITDIASPFTGSLNVGTGQNYTSLTNPAGFFEALNNSGATGNVTINIISDLTGETGAVALNQVAGGFTVTIKPSGAARTISGTSTTTGLIKLNGADNVTIDGSTSGGLDRSLTITNGNTGATVIWIASASASDGATGNTVKNCIISGNTGATIIAGVLSGSGTTFGGAAETANSNNIIQNNQIFRVQNAAFLVGNGTTLDQNWLVTGNDWGSTVAADKLIFRGMLIGNAQNFTVSNNTIKGISSTIGTSSTMSGIQVALADNGGFVTGNKISDVKHNNTTGWGSNGIYLTSTSAASNVTVANNFVSDVASQGFNGVLDTDNGYGIVVAAGGGGGYKIYFNSVLLNTNQGAGAASGITAGINVLTGVAAGAVDLRDNIFASTQTLGTRYGAICSSANTVFSSIDYNDYFAQNVGFIGGSARATLANWQTGTGQDVNSKAVDPLFVSSTAPADLHLQSASTLRSMGLTIAGITTDIDNDPRPGSNPDIGADQFGCLITLDKNHQSFPGNGGNGTVNVTASDPSCTWMATTGAAYIHITSGASGMGNGMVQYTVDANPGPGIRSDTITIGGNTYTVYQGIDFLDVPQASLFYTEIGKLAARGVTLGCGGGNFCPNDPVLRDSMAAFIMRAKGEFNPPMPGSQRFTDVPPANPFYNFIDRLAELGITLGCTPTTYCPADPVKREQMAAFIIRGLGEFNPPLPGMQRFTDVPPENPFYNFIDRMAVLNITLGCSPTTYCPNDTVTRASMAAFLVRAFDL